MQIIDFKHCLINQESWKYNYPNDKLTTTKTDQSDFPTDNE